jgi:hypothetical protein
MKENFQLTVSRIRVGILKASRDNITIIIKVGVH